MYAECLCTTGLLFPLRRSKVEDGRHFKKQGWERGREFSLQVLMNTCQGVFPLSHFFFSPFCQLNFLLGFYHFFLIRNYKGLENLSLLLQVSTRGMSLLLLPHADVRSTSSFLPVVSHNSEKDYLKAARAFHLQERYYTTPNKLYR